MVAFSASRFGLPPAMKMPPGTSADWKPGGTRSTNDTPHACPAMRSGSAGCVFEVPKLSRRVKPLPGL